MDKSSLKIRYNRQINDEAAEWFVEFRDGGMDGEAQKEFFTWACRSPEHIQAFLEVSAFWSDLPHFVSRQTVDVSDLVAQALAEGNVVPLDVDAPRAGRSGTSPARALINRVRYRGFGIAASVVLAGVAASTIVWAQFFRAPTYETEVGEQRSLVLEDGSTVGLNAKSRIRVRYTRGLREVELLEGQALFRVAQDKARPFIVTSDDTRVRAVGTQFDVNRRKTGTTVTVLEGRVAVSTQRSEAADVQVKSPVAGTVSRHFKRSETRGAGTGAWADAMVVDAGEQVTLTQEGPPKPARTDVAAATAWTQRQLVFQNALLTEVVDEFNRYNRRQMAVDDSTLSGVRVTGVFFSTEPNSLLLFLREQLKLNVEENGDRIGISR